MKKTVVLFWLALFAAGMAGSCNKPYTPPEIIGTWGSYLSDYSPFMLYGNAEALDYYPDLKSKVEEANEVMNQILKDPETISISEDGTFTFIFRSGDIARGSYIQNGSYIYFTFTSGHYPEVEALFGETDGITMILHLNSLIIRPIYLGLLDLDIDEYELLFGESNPILSDMRAEVAFSFTHK